MKPVSSRHYPYGMFRVNFFLLYSCAIGFSYSTSSSATETLSSHDDPQAVIQVQSANTHHIAAADAQKQGVGQNIQFIEQLVNHSSAASQIQQGGNAEAKALQQQARHELEKAKKAQQSGDAQAVGDALNKAKGAMFQAMRLSGAKVVKEKQEQDFKQRVQSVNALLEAHKRIRLEKKLAQAAEDVEQHVAAQVQQAYSELQKERIGKAMELANAAYLSIKLSVTRLRDGDTLVRELHFDTKQDEYQYEVERNRTHQILVNVVLKEKLSPQMSLLMKTPMAQAEELHKQAEQQAAQGDYDKAIETLEQSTQQIIRAIRMAGVYIPG